MKAIIQSAKSRIRPIFLTTVTTVFGLLPSALQISVDVFEREISYKVRKLICATFSMGYALAFLLQQ